MRFTMPRTARLRWQHQYRIISTRYPAIDLFERLDLDERQKRALWALQGRINPRLRQATGDLERVRPQDMVSGPGASTVMAAFTHTGFASRFTDGRFGVYYASHTLETAIRETVFHRERDARERGIPAQEFDMRAFVGTVRKPLYDVRQDHPALHDPDPASYPVAQAWTRQLLERDPDAWGIVFNSVRHEGGECIAALRPPAISLPMQGPLLSYVWDGERVTEVYEKSGPLVRF